MTTKFEVGDDIWWLDCKNSRIKYNTILDVEKQNSGDIEYLIPNEGYISSSNTVIANTKEELINILYPPKIGHFDYNQFVYVIETNGHSVGINVTTSLVIDKGYIKGFKSSKTDQYLVGDHKDVHDTDIGWYDAANVYATIDTAKQFIDNWLRNNNDN